MKRVLLGALCCVLVQCSAQTPIGLVQERIRELDKITADTVKLQRQFADELKEKEILLVLLTNFENFVNTGEAEIGQLLKNLRYRNVLGCFDLLIARRAWLQTLKDRAVHQDLVDESDVAELTDGLAELDRQIVQLLNKVMRTNPKKIVTFTCKK